MTHDTATKPRGPWGGRRHGLDDAGTAARVDVSLSATDLATLDRLRQTTGESRSGYLRHLLRVADGESTNDSSPESVEPTA
jgi:hypothetical protein